MDEQLSLFLEQDVPSECCYKCEHFAEFKDARSFTDRAEGFEFTISGVCVRGFNKNGSYYVYPVYVPGAKCKEFLKKKIQKNFKKI